MYEEFKKTAIEDSSERGAELGMDYLMSFHTAMGFRQRIQQQQQQQQQNVQLAASQQAFYGAVALPRRI
jgi:hypothetical protein